MAPRDPIPLRMPREVDEASAEEKESDEPQADEDNNVSFDPFERGPEITEIR